MEHLCSPVYAFGCNICGSVERNNKPQHSYIPRESYSILYSGSPVRMFVYTVCQSFKDFLEQVVGLTKKLLFKIHHGKEAAHSVSIKCQHTLPLFEVYCSKRSQAYAL